MNSIEHKPSGPWEFDQEVTDVFNDMVSRSVPNYEQTMEICADLAARHLRPGDTVLDIGVSRGQALSMIVERLKERGIDNVRMVGIDNSESMLQAAKDELPESVELIHHDLRKGLPYRGLACKPKVILSLWTAQFVPIEYRASLLQNCHTAMQPDGAFLFAEKLRGQTSHHETVMREEYHKWKTKQGYSKESVAEKARSLEGRLVSLSAPEVKGVLMNEGWNPEEVCRYYQFALYYCVKR